MIAREGVKEGVRQGAIEGVCTPVRVQVVDV